MISSRSMTVIDSLALSERGVVDPHLSADGNLLFVASAAGDSLYRFDLRLRRRTAAVNLPRGFLAGPMSSAGERGLWMSSGSRFDDPGTGEVLSFDANLNLTAIIQIPPTPDGVPSVLGRPVVSSDGTVLYTPAGTGRRGPVFGVQPPSIFVTELSTGTTRQQLSLEGWGAHILRIQRTSP